MKQNYCLLALSRSGSTALESVLTKHNSIHHDMTRLPKVEDKRKWVLDFPKRNENIDKPICGFKCILYHYDEFLETDILKNNTFKKIILLRRNLFEAAISKKVAEQIGNWHTKIDYDTVKPFEISKTWLVPYIGFVRKNVDKWLSNSNNFEVFYYEDLFFKTEKYLPVLKFLGVDDPIFSYTISKTNDYSSISKIVSNLKELKDAYEAIK